MQRAKVKKDFREKREAAIKIQSMQRAKAEKKDFQEKRDAAIKIQSMQRAKAEKKEFQEKGRCYKNSVNATIKDGEEKT